MTVYIERTEMKEGYVKLIAWQVERTSSGVEPPYRWQKLAEASWWPKTNSGWLYPKITADAWRMAKYGVTEQEMTGLLKEEAAK